MKLILEVIIVEKQQIANPAPLGLLGFGMTTVLLNLHNAGIISLTDVVSSMGVAMGGTAQIIAGLMEFKKNNVFGATAFTAYGLFWWSLVLIWWNPFALTGADVASMGYYLLLWGIFTLFMAIATLKHNRATQVVFFSLTVLFFLLSAADFSGSETVHTIAGIVGIFCGCSAIYTSLAQVLNNEFKKTVMPLG